MTALHSLWLPILLSAVAVFVLSSVIHMLSPWHRNDFAPMPREDDFRNAVRPLAIPPGDYLVPCPRDRSQLRSPEMQARLAEGPVLAMTVMPNGNVGMARSLVLWFVYLVVVCLFAGYIASRAVPPGTPYPAVFRFVGAAAFLGYAAALWQMSIWYRRSWTLTLKATVDGLVYALVTAGFFGWLWPR